MKRALLFPGQGARGVLEAAAWLRGSELLALALDEARLSFDELEAFGGRALERTEVLQPLLTALCLTVAERLGVTPEVVLGHSLGELAAASAAGAFDARTAVRLAAQRGRLMAREAALNPGGLVALTSAASLRASSAAKDDVPLGASSLGPSVAGRDDAPFASTAGLELAAVNAPDELVCGGPLAALGAHRRVPVSGAWHTSAMRGALEEFRAALLAVAKPLSIALCRNLDGALTHDVGSLAPQLAAPVQFARALTTLVEAGVTTVICVGPGLVMRGLVRKNLGSRVKVLTTEDEADLTRTIAATQGTP